MQSIKYIQVIILSSIAIWTVWSCKDTGTRPDQKEFILPEEGVTFVDHIQPMFEAKCGFESGCHSPSDTDNRLLYVELTNRDGLINHEIRTGQKLVNLVVHKSNPDIAPLYLILLEGYPTPFDDKMPPVFSNIQPLNENQLQGVLQWIREGAPNSD
ncbi:MAG: hypothetical protein GF313_01645 [Caldithrix sp.]|nr:hypothetical protein [Caldithrix sp.]